MGKTRNQTIHPERAERLKAARLEKFRSAAAAARAIGMPISTYTQLESGIRDISKDYAERLSRFFPFTAGFLLFGDEQPSGKIPNIRFGGAIGAGQMVLPSSDMDGFIEGLIGVDGGEAFEVVGDSMQPLAKPGDVVFFGAPRHPKLLIGREAIVELVDGTRLFKTIERGSSTGRYDLLSYNSSPIRDVEIERAGPFLGLRRGHK
jgi:transcriptional regulator with XRE-family HTH domain